MSLERRLQHLEELAQSRSGQGKHTRTGAAGLRDDVNALLADNGLPALDAGPVWPQLLERLQAVDGWNLSGMPGDTLEEKEQACDLVAQGKIDVDPAVGHAARYWLALWDGL